jgi:hypothetical protein
MRFVWLLVMAGCVHSIEEDASTVGVLVRDCVVSETLGAPVSLEYPDRSLWLWSDGAAFVVSAESACRSGVVKGPPFTASDVTPLGGFVHDGIGYLFVEAAGGGTELCTIAPAATQCDPRPVAFAQTERVINRGGVVDGDRALLLGCRPVAAFESPCLVTGAPLDRLDDPAAYQVWNVFSGWEDELSAGSSLGNELGAVTLSRWNERWLATSVDPFTGQVYARFSSEAQGDYGHRIAMFSVSLTESGFVSGGREHAGLRREPGTLHLTYAAGGLHLVTFRFHDEDVE